MRQSLNKTPWSPEEDEILYKYYTEMGPTFCAPKLPNRIKTAIAKRAKNLKIPFLGILGVKERKFVDRYFPVFGRRFCADRLGVTINDVSPYIKRAELKSIPLQDIDMTSLINEYMDIWKPEIVYLLGLIWADGHLTKTREGLSRSFSLTLTAEDAKMIEANFSAFDGLHISKYVVKAGDNIIRGKKGKRKESHKFSVSDMFLGKFLEENDYGVKSGASACKILSQIPDHLKHFWWRGYFEGDGCIYFDKIRRGCISISSVIYQDWTFYKNLCDELDIFYYHSCFPQGKGGHSIVALARINDILKFCEYIYQGREIDKIGLERKYLTFTNKGLKEIRTYSGVTGVSFDKRKKKKPWMAYYSKKFLGYFKTKEEALNRRQEYLNDNNIQNYKSQTNRATGDPRLGGGPS